MFTFLVVLGALAATAQDFSPVPVSEYAEKSGPNTITFLSYPKYYQDHSGQLTLVDTNLVPSKDTEWDFEVTTGIWSLRVRGDGTFQAEHAGDSFTYRLDKIGVGRGDAFRSLELGEANWKNFQVVGDTIRWYDVFRDIDLAVRYIHDILKVDVIVKAKLMSEIRAEVKSGKWDGDDYLTARFQIPNVWVTSEARQNGQSRDLCADALDIRQPLEFVKDEKVIHKLRPVETYVLDAKGEPIIPIEEESRIHCAQVWQLKKDAPGIAEMSANLRDLAMAEEGDVVIDPSLVFGVNNGAKDAVLYERLSTQTGTDQTLSWNNTGRYIVGFNLNDSIIGRTITSAKLLFYEISSTVGSSATARSYKITSFWDENDVNWFVRDNLVPWIYPWGGNFESRKYHGKKTFLPSASFQWVEIDVSQAFKSHLSNSIDDNYIQGFIVCREDTDSGILSIVAKENTSYTTYRPRLSVTYSSIVSGSGVGRADDRPAPYHNLSKLDQLKADRMYETRFGYHELMLQDAINFTYDANTKSVGVLPVFWCSYVEDPGIPPTTTPWWSMDNLYSQNPSGYANYIRFRLEETEDDNLSINILGNTIKLIEIGAEEESKWNDSDGDPFDSLSNNPPYWFGNETDGQRFAPYYLAARNTILQYFPNENLELISGGSVEKHESVVWPQDTDWGSAGYFIRGFIEQCIDEADSTPGCKPLDLLPDTIAIHSYAGKRPPEYYAWDGRIGNPYDPRHVTEWMDRLKDLYEICDEFGYIPNFALTEYGFCMDASLTSDYPGHAPTNAGEESQAVYYLRSCLMNATMGVLDSGQWKLGLGWKCQYYFDHWYSDMAFYTTDSPIDDRIIRGITRELFNTSIGLADPYTKIWVPIQRTNLNTVNNFPLTRKAWCGWNLQNGDRWVSAWLYNQNESYDTLGPLSFVIEIDGDYRDAPNQDYDIDIWHFDLSYDIASFTKIVNDASSWVSYDSQTDKTTISIPSTPGLTQNPIFIRCVQK